MNDTIRTGRVKLAEAAWRHTANPDDGREWQALHERRKVDALPEADHHRFFEINAVIYYEVMDRLASGEWVAWGWQQGSVTPSKIPIELFERGDIRINVESNILSCDVCAFDSVTVDVTMTSVPTVAKRRKASEKEIRSEFTAWVMPLDEYPSKKEADQWAIAHGYSTAIVRPLHAARNPRHRGDSKQKAGLKGS